MAHQSKFLPLFVVIFENMSLGGQIFCAFTHVNLFEFKLNMNVELEHDDDLPIFDDCYMDLLQQEDAWGAKSTDRVSPTVPRRDFCGEIDDNKSFMQLKRECFERSPAVNWCREMLPCIYTQVAQRQHDMTAGTRMEHVEWFLYWVKKWKLPSATLFLAVDIMDRFFAVQVVDMDKSNLACTMILFMSAKFEGWKYTGREVYGKRDGLHLWSQMLHTPSTYKEMRFAERCIMSSIDFKISAPTTYTFYHLYDVFFQVHFDQQTVKVLRKMLIFNLELALFIPEFIGMNPQKICAVCIFHARQTLDPRASKYFEKKLDHRRAASDALPGEARVTADVLAGEVCEENALASEYWTRELMEFSAYPHEVLLPDVNILEMFLERVKTHIRLGHVSYFSSTMARYNDMFSRILRPVLPNQLQ